ncbi:MAG: NYN domain-containing protein [Coriobacteriales bacterium]|jgi:predicted RNA-binding protein with PIN domain|nr:NYN domain-containing protein [Coriobacteriales bacterium]
MNKLLLIDGYNVLRSGSLYSHIVTPDYTHDVPNAAREALLDDVALFSGHDYEAWIIYDAAYNPSSDGTPRERAGIKVVFSQTGTSADSAIEGMARAAASVRRDVLVVTSDATTQWTVLGNHVTRMSAEGFCGEVRALKRELYGKPHADLVNGGQHTVAGVDAPVSHTTAKGAVKHTLGERLDESTRKKLEGLL